VNGDKICSIGIAASDWITYHGLSMNVNVDLRYYSMIRVCGYDDVMATSLEKLLKRRLDMDEVKRHLLRGLIKALDLKETKLEEGPILA
jgi:lipoate-protein ligase B